MEGGFIKRKKGDTIEKASHSILGKKGGRGDGGIGEGEKKRESSLHSKSLVIPPGMLAHICNSNTKQKEAR